MKIIAIAIVLTIALTSLACAATISVTPATSTLSTDGNWVAAKMGTGGTSQRGSAYQFWPSTGDFNKIGGAINPFAATCGGSTKIGTVNYGTDLFKGRLLADIVELSYTVYMFDTATMPWTASQANPHPEYGNGRAYGLEIVGDKGDGNQRDLVYIAPTVAYNQWVTINPLAEGTWKNMNVNSGALDHTWDSLKGALMTNASISNHVLTSGETRSYGDLWKTVSGKSFNFVAGSRVTSMTNFSSWANSWYNTSGYLGSLTVKFAGDAEATTYQFVPEPGSLLALATGLIGFIGLRKRSR